MPGVLALLLVIVGVFLIFFSENLQKKKIEEQLHTIIGNKKVLYGSMTNLTVRKGLQCSCKSDKKSGAAIGHHFFSLRF